MEQRPAESRPELLRMEQAIATGDPEHVSALLEALKKRSKATLVGQLTGCYGGAGPDPQSLRDERKIDVNGLFPMAVPILHAAYSGSTSIFSIVYGAMQDNLRAQQVRDFTQVGDAFQCE